VQRKIEERVGAMWYAKKGIPKAEFESVSESVSATSISNAPELPVVGKNK
jgi:hypothetical protein